MSGVINSKKQSVEDFCKDQLRRKPGLVITTPGSPGDTHEYYTIIYNHLDPMASYKIDCRSKAIFSEDRFY